MAGSDLFHESPPFMISEIAIAVARFAESLYSTTRITPSPRIKHTLGAQSAQSHRVQDCRKKASGKEWERLVFWICNSHNSSRFIDSSETQCGACTFNLWSGVILPASNYPLIPPGEWLDRHLANPVSMKPHRAIPSAYHPFGVHYGAQGRKIPVRPSGIRRANIAVGANRWPNIERVCRRISHSIGYFIPARRRRHRRRESHPRENSERNGTVGFIALAKRLTFSSWARLSRTSCTLRGCVRFVVSRRISLATLLFFSRATVEFSPRASVTRWSIERWSMKNARISSHRSSLMQFTLASLSTFSEERSAFNASNTSRLVYIKFCKTALARINNARFPFTRP